jgi:hypothetical protein
MDLAVNGNQSKKMYRGKRLGLVSFGDDPGRQNGFGRCLATGIAWLKGTIKEGRLRKSCFFNQALVRFAVGWVWRQERTSVL